MRGGLTKQQAALLAYLRDYIARNEGVAPTFSEMTRELKLGSKSGTTRLLEALEERGFITRMPKRTRCISLVENEPSSFERGWSAGYAKGYRAACEDHKHHALIGADA